MKILQNLDKTFVDIRGKEFINKDEANAQYVLVDFLGSVSGQQGFNGNERVQCFSLAKKIMDATKDDDNEYVTLLVEDQEALLLRKVIEANNNLPVVVERQLLDCIVDASE